MRPGVVPSLSALDVRPACPFRRGRRPGSPPARGAVAACWRLGPVHLFARAGLPVLSGEEWDRPFFGGARITPSSLNMRALRAIPPGAEKPRRSPRDPITRCHGTARGTGFLAITAPTALAAPQAPAAAATSP